ncbi:hypothetical protein JRQ81_012312 [Phrynocephalus forsythii]|uniref:Uncharacterized protein n=1 Tax=Phrynocephalus forsythii TaxID=171643 RepID=A0A9Q0X5Z7_9SAUR|nr:hypothetical protein JRQ81_012312 [Phrynocephalus forsythii]
MKPQASQGSATLGTLTVETEFSGSGMHLSTRPEFDPLLHSDDSDQSSDDDYGETTSSALFGREPKEPSDSGTRRSTSQSGTRRSPVHTALLSPASLPARLSSPAAEPDGKSRPALTQPASTAPATTPPDPPVQKTEEKGPKPGKKTEKHRKRHQSPSGSRHTVPSADLPPISEIATPDASSGSTAQLFPKDFQER